MITETIPFKSIATIGLQAGKQLQINETTPIITIPFTRSLPISFKYLYAVISNATLLITIPL